MENAIENNGSVCATSMDKAGVYTRYKTILEKEMEDVAEMTIGAVMRCIRKIWNGNLIRGFWEQ